MAGPQLTLNKEDLLRKIWEELRPFLTWKISTSARRPLRDEMHFDLEMMDGVRKPPRSGQLQSPPPNTYPAQRQPVLIRDNYVAEFQTSVEPIRTRGCFCGVPLVAYDTPSSHGRFLSDQERVFDEATLSSCASWQRSQHLAIENARLFHESAPKRATSLSSHHLPQRHRHA